MARAPKLITQEWTCCSKSDVLSQMRKSLRVCESAGVCFVVPGRWLEEAASIDDLQTLPVVLCEAKSGNKEDLLEPPC